MGKKQGIGSSFDDFLEEEGILASCGAVATKRVLVYELRKAMEIQHISEAEMSTKMKAGHSTVSRLLDPDDTSATLEDMASAMVAMGKRITLRIV